MSSEVINSALNKKTGKIYRLFPNYLLLAILTAPAVANATFLSFSERTLWEAAVANAGLGVVTNEFNTDPESAFSLGGSDFSRTGGTYTNERLEGIVVRLGFESGGPLYGFGFDFGGTGTAAARARDTNGVFGQQGTFSTSGDTFAGIISDVPLSTVCGNVFTCPGFGSDEVYISMQGGSGPFIDNFSVAVSADSDGDGISRQCR